MVNVDNVKKVSFFITFVFCDANDEKNIFANGYQQIVLANKNKKIIRFPSGIINKIEEYQI